MVWLEQNLRQQQSGGWYRLWGAEEMESRETRQGAEGQVGWWQWVQRRLPLSCVGSCALKYLP